MNFTVRLILYIITLYGLVVHRSWATSFGCYVMALDIFFCLRTLQSGVKIATVMSLPLYVMVFCGLYLENIIGIIFAEGFLIMEIVAILYSWYLEYKNQPKPKRKPKGKKVAKVIRPISETPIVIKKAEETQEQEKVISEETTSTAEPQEKNSSVTEEVDEEEEIIGETVSFTVRDTNAEPERKRNIV